MVTSLCKKSRLLSGSGVVAGTSRDQAGDEGAKQGFAASPSIVHEESIQDRGVLIGLG